MTTLEKIRAEIEREQIADFIAVQTVLEIIDKYASEECDRDCEHCAYIECPKEPTTLKQIIEKHNMDKLAYDEMSDFERDVLKYAEQEPCCKVEKDENGYAHVSPIEPCEDAVSRRAVLEIIKSHTLTDDYLAVEQLPSVQPKSETVTEFADRCRECGAKYGKLLKQEPKTGHWILDEDKSLMFNVYKCSNCENIGARESNFCPNCGAEMKGGE